jgi:hypothetical protein
MKQWQVFPFAGGAGLGGSPTHLSLRLLLAGHAWLKRQVSLGPRDDLGFWRVLAGTKVGVRNGHLVATTEPTALVMLVPDPLSHLTTPAA